MLHSVKCANVCHTTFTASTLAGARSLHVREHMARRQRDARRAAQVSETWDPGCPLLHAGRHAQPDHRLNALRHPRQCARLALHGQPIHPLRGG